MSPTVVLAVGADSSLLAAQRQAWRSAGYHITFAASIREAIVQLRDGDFDLILLYHSIPRESRERLTFLIRASGSRVPVVCITESPRDYDSFADATIQYEPDNLREVIGELLAERAKTQAAAQPDDEDKRPKLHLLKDLRTLQMLWSPGTSKLSGGIR